MEYTTEELKETDKCAHSEESILLLLSHAPQRLSIKEISSVTKWHRNTIRAQLNELKSSNKIKIMGEGNHSVYYTQSVIDHYRQVAKTLYETISNAGMDDQEKLNVLREFGKNLVTNTIDNVFGDDANFKHKNLYDVFAHFKMSYPFNDVINCCSTVEFIPGEFSFTQTDQNRLPDFELTFQLHPCLCKGEEEYSYACSMVEGAIQASLERIGDYVPYVQKIDDVNSPNCTYFIKTDGHDNYKLVPDGQIV